MIIAAAQNQPVLGPDDLGANIEPRCFEAFCNGGRVQSAMPDIGNITREQGPGLAPVRTVIIQHLAGAFGLCGTRLVAPARIVLHAVGRIGHHQQRLRPVQNPLHIGGHRGITAKQTVFAKNPKVARTADRFLRCIGNIVFALGLAQRRTIQIPKQAVQFFVREPHQVQIEIQIIKRRQFRA